MAKKNTSKKKMPTAKRKRSVANDDGPVTLSEARDLAKAKSPKRAARRRGTIKVATPEAVGIAREKLDKQQRDENSRRIREYKAMMSIMKKRGVKGLKPKSGSAPKRRSTRSRIPDDGPLQIFAEGDSWFDYPVPFFGGGIIPRLESLLGVPILSLAKAGAEVRNMLGVEERKVLMKHLADGCPAGGDWDVLLFSGGGNDIVGDSMTLWVKEYDPAVVPAKLIHRKRFDAALALVRAGYQDIIGLRDSISPKTHLVFHAYDFAIPDGRGICHLGPWLKPTFDLHQFKKRDAAFEVVKKMLQQFAKELLSVQKRHKGVTVINGQGTLAPRRSSWHNELHPSRNGYKKFAKLFHQELRELFPDRVL